MWNNPKGANLGTVLLALLVLAIFMLGAVGSPPPPREVAYSQFLQDVKEGRVASAVIGKGTLMAQYAQGNERVWVGLPPDYDNLQAALTERGVSLEYTEGGRDWPGGLFTLIFLVLVVGGLIWLVKGQGDDSGQRTGAGQVYSFGQSHPRTYAGGDRPITMDDVAGMPEVKEELAEIIDFLRWPERYRELGARIPRGVLLYGPPGTGKTLLARAVAGEAKVRFFSISGSEFVEIFAGVGASRVRDLFVKARLVAPCIIFVDEIDAVGRQRGLSYSGGADERDQTLNQLLVEMDGFGPNEGIVVMAATNRLDVLDAALLRPGRFDRQIAVDPPDRLGRREILAVHATGKRLVADVDLDRVAALTAGFTGADLANLLNEAALMAARGRLTDISMDEISRAYERIVTGGPPSRRIISPHERYRVAVHEAGHAIVARILPHCHSVDKVSITARGRSLGYVLFRPKDDKYVQSRSELIDQMTAMLGGRAAEEVVFGELTTGAADDLAKATDLARRMVSEWGMSDRIGPVAFGESSAADDLSHSTAVAVDEAVEQFVKGAHARAIALLQQKQTVVERLANALVERESIDGDELDQFLAAQQHG